MLTIVNKVIYRQIKKRICMSHKKDFFNLYKETSSEKTTLLQNTCVKSSEIS